MIDLVLINDRKLSSHKAISIKPRGANVEPRTISIRNDIRNMKQCAEKLKLLQFEYGAAYEQILHVIEENNILPIHRASEKTSIVTQLFKLLNTASLVDFLKNNLLDLLDDIPYAGAVRRDMRFQMDGAPAHWTVQTRRWLSETVMPRKYKRRTDRTVRSYTMENATADVLCGKCSIRESARQHDVRKSTLALYVKKARETGIDNMIFSP
ncbi:hypothetical protein ILUMI_09697 [Ignelater luminosus]|uniref:Uncharacterized protein n=1 Tax=Ignelater luminosus TaxID=2038154 RepID=A0A8K0D3Q2_IGNLU|nr:hypothetical protein ILUMI_09697 [Ignelater luminosus]